MAEVVLHSLYIVTGTDGSHGVAVPEIVKAGIRAADLSYNALVFLGDRPRYQMTSDLVCKNKVLRIAPQTASAKLRGGLALPMLAEYIHYPGRGRDRARLVVL